MFNFLFQGRRTDRYNSSEKSRKRGGTFIKVRIETHLRILHCHHPSTRYAEYVDRKLTNQHPNIFEYNSYLLNVGVYHLK